LGQSLYFDSNRQLRPVECSRAKPDAAKAVERCECELRGTRRRPRSFLRIRGSDTVR